MASASGAWPLSSSAGLPFSQMPFPQVWNFQYTEAENGASRSSMRETACSKAEILAGQGSAHLLRFVDRNKLRRTEGNASNAGRRKDR